MTENEAIDKLNNLHYKILHSSFCSMVYESEIEALCMAKDCLKEIQQYRAIGTVEEFRKLRKMFGDDFLEMSEVVKRILKEYPEYQSIGTVEELKILKEKNVAKKPRFYEHNYYCTECGNLVGNNEFEWQRFLYCDKCGQKLDWQ